MLRTASAHTWLSTISAILAIFIWLTGLQTLKQIGDISLSNWNSSQGAVAITILGISIVVVFGAFYVIATLIFARVCGNGALRSPAKNIFMFIGFGISLMLYDTFWGFNQLLANFNSGISINLIFSSFLATVCVFLIPYKVNESAYSNAEDWACSNCGRFTLTQLAHRETNTRQTKRRLTNEDGERFIRVEEWQDYEIERICPHCNSIWKWSRSYSLGEHDYPAE